MPDDLDDLIASGLRRRGATGVPRGPDAVLRTAQSLAVDDSEGGPDRMPVHQRSQRSLRVAAAVLIVAIVALVIGAYRGPSGDDATTPGTAAPTSGPATSSTTLTSTDGCPIAAECALPPHPTDLDVPDLPPGWTLVDTSRGPLPASLRALFRTFAAPQADIQVPGGPVPQRIRLVLYLEPAVTSRARAEWASKPAIPLGQGRTLYLPDSRTLQAGNPSLTITTIGADLGGEMSVQATGEGVSAEVVQRAVASIVVR